MTRHAMPCSVTDSIDEHTPLADGKRSPMPVVHRVEVHATDDGDDNQQATAHPSGDALTLSQLVETIEKQFKQDSKTPLNKRAVFRTLLERFDGELHALEKFAFVDPSKNYTRNLISTDHENYALILIVWNKGKYSPIHDHPCDGCWVKVLHGSIHEVQYQLAQDTSTSEGGGLIESSNLVLSEGVTYMDDSIGLHKIGNPRDDTDAITLHLYSPPYDKCRVWLDPGNASKSSVAYSYYFSEFGERADY